VQPAKPGVSPRLRSRHVKAASNTEHPDALVRTGFVGTSRPLSLLDNDHSPSDSPERAYRAAIRWSQDLHAREAKPKPPAPNTFGSLTQPSPSYLT
jgi:hypothetical protein